jgi:hypothetical protein
MPRLDRQREQLTRFLVEVWDDELLPALASGTVPVLLHRVAGAQQYLTRRYRTPAMQEIESAMRDIERIDTRLGILREDSILSVFDRYLALAGEPDPRRRDADLLAVAETLRLDLERFRVE